MDILLSNEFETMSLNEMYGFEGGAWSWSECGNATGNGAIAGAIALGAVGATSGSCIPGAGTVTGAVVGAGIGFVCGAVVGFVGYALFGWW